MLPFEKVIDAACAAEQIPGVVLMASGRSGGFEYARAFGKRSVREGADQSALTLDSVMWIASCTKVVTSIAALQCVERGLLSLDEPIYGVLPELKSMPVVKFKNGKPELIPHKKPITLRHLLNHSSGIAYDETHPKLMAWHQHMGTKPNRKETVKERHDYPLVFEPGEGWCYGAGIDWAGYAIECVNGGMSLQEYCQKNIFAPLGATDVVFSPYLHTRPDMKQRLADMSKRDPERPDKVKRSNARLQFNESGQCFGGLGLFASPRSYIKILKGLLMTDENQKLLKKETTEEFFRPSLSKKAKAGLNQFISFEETRPSMGNFPSDVQADWGLGGILNDSDIPGGRRAGTMTWSGLPNLAWFVDRESGTCGFFATQLLPPSDPRAAELCGHFEKGLFDMISNPKAKF